MTPTQELIKDLKAAIVNKAEHNQKLFFNECGTAACIAGQKVDRDIKNKIINVDYTHHGNCWEYSRKAYDLNGNMADFIFNENANYVTHQLAVKVIEQRLENKLGSCQYVNDTIYNRPNFSLIINTVGKDTEDTFKLLTNITKEVGANLHRRSEYCRQFLIEKGLDFELEDLEAIFINAEL